MNILIWARLSVRDWILGVQIVVLKRIYCTIRLRTIKAKALPLMELGVAIPTRRWRIRSRPQKMSRPWPSNTYSSNSAMTSTTWWTFQAKPQPSIWVIQKSHHLKICLNQWIRLDRLTIKSKNSRWMTSTTLYRQTQNQSRMSRWWRNTASVWEKPANSSHCHRRWHSNERTSRSGFTSKTAKPACKHMIHKWTITRPRIWVSQATWTEKTAKMEEIDPWPKHQIALRDYLNRTQGVRFAWVASIRWSITNRIPLWISITSTRASNKSKKRMTMCLIREDQPRSRCSNRI